MKRQKFIESRIIKVIKENEQGRKAEEVSRELGIHKGHLQLALEITQEQLAARAGTKKR